MIIKKSIEKNGKWIEIAELIFLPGNLKEMIPMHPWIKEKCSTDQSRTARLVLLQQFGNIFWVI